MTQEKSLLDKVSKLESKVKNINPDEVRINNFIFVMREFHLDHRQVKSMPIYAMNSILKQLDKEQKQREKDDKDKKNKKTLGGLKGLRG